MSYMVRFGEKFPQKIHHRGSVLPCIVGDPAEDDTFQDSRYNVPQSEPTTTSMHLLWVFWLTLNHFS